MYHSRITGLVLGAVFFLNAGCASTQPPDEVEPTVQQDERIAGGIAAVAGEAAGKDDTITRKDVENRPGTFAEQLLQGQVAGVEVIERPGGGFSVRIRGKSSILGGSEPLYVVDGMQITQDSRQGLSWLNIHDIEKIEVLKNASATAIYGTRGANGVVLITTKRGFENQ